MTDNKYKIGETLQSRNQDGSHNVYIIDRFKTGEYCIQTLKHINSETYGSLPYTVYESYLSKNYISKREIRENKLKEILE